MGAGGEIYLADTAVLLLAAGNERKLSAAARTALEDGPVCLSVLSYWEVVIKSARGKLDVGRPDVWWEDSRAHLDASILPLQTRHLHAINSLPLLHKDPFDRALIGQAIADGLILVTPDREIARYTAAGLKLLR